VLVYVPRWTTIVLTGCTVWTPSPSGGLTPRPLWHHTLRGTDSSSTAQSPPTPTASPQPLLHRAHSPPPMPRPCASGRLTPPLGCRPSTTTHRYTHRHTYIRKPHTHTQRSTPPALVPCLDWSLCFVICSRCRIGKRRWTVGVWWAASTRGTRWLTTTTRHTGTRHDYETGHGNTHIHIHTYTHPPTLLGGHSMHHWAPSGSDGKGGYVVSG
jgi:hypothetical protein